MNFVQLPLDLVEGGRWERFPPFGPRVDVLVVSPVLFPPSVFIMSSIKKDFTPCRGARSRKEEAVSVLGRLPGGLGKKKKKSFE